MKMSSISNALLLLICLKISSSLVLRKRQSDLFSNNDFDASLVTNTNTGGGMAPSRSGSYSNMDNSNMMTGSNSAGRGFGSSSSNGDGAIGGRINPFNSNGNEGRNSMASFGGSSNGNSMGSFGGQRNGNSMSTFGGPGSGNSAGPFTGSASGNSAGPFTGGASGNSAGPFAGATDGKSMGPFSGGSKENSGTTPFSGYSKGVGSKNPFSVVKGNSIDTSKLFPLDSKYISSGMKSPFDSSSLKGGPGGMTGSVFNTDMGTNDGPGGLNGGSFMSYIDNNGPGGLSGGSFLKNSGSPGSLGGTDSKFDTSEYEQMLKEMFATDSNKDEGNPFDPNSYTGDINTAGTGQNNLNAAGTRHYQEYNSGHSGSSYGSYSSGNDGRYTDTYQTPFNEKTDYNELLSNPFQSSADNSRTSGQGYKDQSVGTAYSPFKADRGMPGLAAMNNPGGNPFNQYGSQVGRG